MDVRNRAQKEALAAQGLARLLADERRELVALLGNPPDVANVPDAYWIALRDKLRRQLVNYAIIFYLLYQDDLSLALPALPVGVPNRQRRAAEFAASHADTIATRYTARTRDYLSQADPTGFDLDQLRRPMVPPDLSRRLVIATGPAVVERMAVGTVTGASTRSHMDLDDQFRAAGAQVSAIWRTEEDDRVCRVCGPLNGTSQDYWAARFPAGPGDEVHPNCRCWLESDVRMPGGRTGRF